MSVQLERHEQEYQEIYSSMLTLLQKKAKVLAYPPQMTKIPECPFNKIAIDLVTVCETSSSGNKHILTIIDHLTGWPEAFPISDKSAYTIAACSSIIAFQSTCVLDLYYQIMALNSRITSGTKYFNLALITFFPHLTTLKATGS